MRHISIILLLMLVNYSLQAQLNKIDIKDFFRNPVETDFSISPSGKYIAYRADFNGRMNVFVKELRGAKAVMVTRDTIRSISTYLWKGDRILYLQDVGGDENFQLHSVAADGSKSINLTPFAGYRTNIVDELQEVKGKENEILISLNKRDKRVFDLYSLNVVTGDLSMQVQNNKNFIAWLPANYGVLRVAVSTDGVNNTYMYRNSEKDTFSVLLKTNFKEKFQFKQFSGDNTRFYALSNIGRDKLALVLFDPTTKKQELVFEHPFYDLSGMGYEMASHKLISAYWVASKVEREFLDNKRKLVYQQLGSKLTNYDFDVVSFNRTKDYGIVRARNDRTRAIHYLYDFNSRALKLLSNATPWLNAADLAPMQAISYKTRDGLTIHGYLTLPPGKKKNNLPTIVLPHGGPWIRDEWGYNPEVQFLANRGYAVLQMNYRGSSGYGKQFLEASYKQWGRKMQDDITDGVQWVIQKGIADKKRIGIYGGSYGGYAALAAITFTPNLYACAVDYVGISNLFTFINAFPPYYKPYLDQVYEMIGHPKKDSVLLASISPLFHVDKIKVPLFVAQGANDPRVKKSESDQIVNAMKERGIYVEYLVKENEGHGFRNQENKFELYAAVEKFLDRFLKSPEQGLKVSAK